MEKEKIKITKALIEYLEFIIANDIKFDKAKVTEVLDDSSYIVAEVKIKKYNMEGKRYDF